MTKFLPRDALLASLILLAPGAACAQELAIPTVAYPSIAPSASTAEGFIPKGWRIEARATGDLNGDGADDLILVLRDTEPRNVLDNKGLGPNRFDTNPRMTVVAFKRAAGGYDFALANHSLIPRNTQPTIDDPMEDADPPKIRNGILRLSLHLFANAGGADMGSMSFAFRYQDRRFVLIGYDSSIVQRMSGETTDVSVNYLTGKKKTAVGRIDSDHNRVRWITLPARPLLTLDEVGDGMEFDPDHPPS